jgi:hypothetical protein
MRLSSEAIMTTQLQHRGRRSGILRSAGAALGSAVTLAPAVLVLTLILSTAASSAVEKVLHNFTDGKDGKHPAARLLFDPAGNLYGVTAYGGISSESTCVIIGCGVVFEMRPASSGIWKYKVLHTFCLVRDCADGAFPSGGLISDSAGNLYGSTSGSGNIVACIGYGCGVVYRLSPTPSGPWNYTVLFTFPGGSGGARPGILTLDSAGNLFGEATIGGHVGASCDYYAGCGLVFELTPNPGDTTWTEKVLHTFTGRADGGLPAGGLIFDLSGNLFGTTQAGGIKNLGNCYQTTCGVAFQLTPNPDGTWQETVIHSFTGGSDGGYPTSGLIFDPTGNLYGTSSPGGLSNVFQFTPNPNGGWTEKVIGSIGGSTYAPVLRTSNGNLYGTSANLGAHNGGFVFEYRPNPDGSWTESIIYDFCSRIEHKYRCLDGNENFAGLIDDAAGNLYGVTYIGGKNDDGIVFQLQK